MNSFLIMMMLFTRINIKKELNFSQEEFKKGIVKVPFIGLIIGAILYLFSMFMRGIQVDGVTSSIIIYALYILLTGGLHIDGLSDTFDGIYSNRDKDRILEIMKDSNIGTFGVLAIVILSLLNISAISNLDPKYLIIFPVFSRVLIILIAYMNKYARKDGMGKIFIDSASLKDFGITAILFLVMLVYILGTYSLVAALISTIVTIMWTRKIAEKIDGITGDVLGFSIEISQCVFLISSYIVVLIAKMI